MNVAKRVLFLVWAMAAVLNWAGCGGGCPNTSINNSSSGGGSGSVHQPGTICGPGNGGGNGASAAFLYYLGTNEMLAASLSTTKVFAALSPFTPPALPSSAGSDMVIVNKTFLYLPQSDSLTVQAFSTDHSSGALTAVAGSPFASSAADSVISDPAGRFLFVGGENTGQISVFQINSTTGALVAAPGSPFSAFNLDFAHILAVDGAGKFLYVGQGSPFLPIYAFSIDQNNGALSLVPGSPFTLGVAGVRTDNSGKFAIGNSGVFGENSLFVFSIDTTGALAPVSGSPFATTAVRVFNVRVHPGNQFVYSFGEDSNGNVAAIEGFQLNPASGALTALSGSPFTTVPIVADCKWDQGGSSAFCANDNGAAFSVLDTDTATGGLAHTVTDLSVGDSFVPFAPTN